MDTTIQGSGFRVSFAIIAAFRRKCGLQLRGSIFAVFLDGVHEAPYKYWLVHRSGVHVVSIMNAAPCVYHSQYGGSALSAMIPTIKGQIF